MEKPKFLTVLLVDDSVVIRRWWQTVLSEIPGVTVVGEAANGLEALELFEKVRPDAMLLDVEMPGENGFHVLREIRKHDKACLVIMMSSYREDAYEKACYEFGADHYFAKLGAADGFAAVLKARMEGLRSADCAATDLPNGNVLEK